MSKDAITASIFSVRYWSDRGRILQQPTAVLGGSFAITALKSLTSIGGRLPIPRIARSRKIVALVSGPK
eukprot:8908388-Pyramimonas_sp.AAC.1